MMEIIFLTFKILFILFFVGYGFTAIFIPEKLRRDAFWLAPWFGMMLISVVGVMASMAGFTMSQAKYFTLLVAVLLSIYATLNKKKLFFISRESAIISLLAIVCLIFNLYPLLAKVGFPTTISLGNLDPITYTHTADFLKNNTVYSGAIFEHYKPYLWATGDLLQNGFRWGTPMLLSFLSSLFDVRSYQIYSILITLFFVLSFPITYVLAKQIIQRLKSYLLLFLIFLTFAFNSTLLYMLYNVFFAQFIFVGVFITIIILFHGYISENKKNISFNEYDFLIAFSLSSLTILYLEGLFFIFVPVFIFVFLSLIRKKYTPLLYLGKIILLVLIINPTSFGNAMRLNYKVFLNTTKIAIIGWEKIRYSSPLEMLGFYNLYYSRIIPTFINIVSSLAIISIIFFGFVKSKQKLLIGSFMGFFIALYIVFGLFFKNFFTYHRSVTYTLFLIAILFSCGILYVFSLFKSKIVKSTIIIIFFLMTARSSYRTIYQLYWHPRIVDKSLISLTDLNNDVNMLGTFYTSDVYLGEYDLWKRLWREYMLTSKLIVTRQNYPTESKNLDGIKLVLAEKNYLEGEDKKIIFKNIVWENEFYRLGEIEPISVASDLQKYK